MAFSYTNYFTNRVGKGLYYASMALEFAGMSGSILATDLPTEWEDFVETYDSANAEIRACIDGSETNLTNAQTAMAVIPAWVAKALTATTISMVNSENQLPKLAISEAMVGLIALMVADSKTVDANAVTAAATAGTNSGDGKIVLSVLNGDGKTLEYCYDETLDVSFSSATRSKFRGEAKAGSLLQYNWPLGSGATKTVTVCDADSNGLVTNGNFDTFTVANTPDSWTIAVGTAGTHIFSESSTIYTGTKALKITGNGSTLTSLTQNLDVTQLESKVPYAINFYCRTSTNPAAGVVTIDLYDGSGVIADEAGTSNSFTIDPTTLGTTYTAKNGVFRLPEPIPATVTLRIRQTTAITNTHSLYIDHLQMIDMDQLYDGGPYAAVFQGATDFSTDDTFTVAVTNDYGGAVQTWFWRMFNMPSLGLVLPSNAAGGENIADSIIA